MALDRMKGITTPTQKIEEMSRVTLQRPPLTGETPEVEDDPQLSEESP